jgi:hypothetical protein
VVAPSIERQDLDDHVARIDVRPRGAQVSVANGDGLAHIATADEIKAKRWRIPGKTVVVFQPPHPAARFRAFPSLAEGAKGWMDHHKKVAAKYAKYVDSANAGNCKLIAHYLKLDCYYTGNEGIYATSMTSKKAESIEPGGRPCEQAPCFHRLRNVGLLS